MTERWERHPQQNLSGVAAEWAEAEPFKDTWPAFRKDDIDVRRLDTNMLRIGWPKPTIYREHETIHVLANLVDQLRKRLDELCTHENFVTSQNGMWNHDTCLDCGINGPTYDIDLGLNDTEGRPGNFEES